MVAHVPGECMKLPLVPLAALLLGGVSALAVLALPAGVEDAFLSVSHEMLGIPTAPPLLADLARPMSALATGAIVTGIGLLFARRGERAGSAAVPSPVLDTLPTPIIRRANSASETRPWSTPGAILEAGALPRAELPDWQADAPGIVGRNLPADLDQPLAAYDPLAIPAVPLPPPVPPRRERAASAGARVSSARDAADRLVRPETDASVHALLDRLEHGVVRRNQVSQVRGRLRTDRGLDDALAALRSLARQA